MRSINLLLSIAILGICPIYSFSQEIVLPKEVKGGTGDFITVTAQAEGKVEWLSVDGLKLFPTEFLKDTKTAIVFSATPGKYRLYAWTAKKDVPSKAALCYVIVDGGNTPAPKPDDSKPKPPPIDPKPQPISEPWVLMVYESADIARYPSSQVAALYGKEVRSYLNANTKEWRVWDKDQPMNNESKGWQFMMSRPRTSLPWIAIGDGQRIAHEGPLPLTGTDTVNLIKAILGQKTSQSLVLPVTPALPVVMEAPKLFLNPITQSATQSAPYCPTCQRR